MAKVTRRGILKSIAALPLVKTMAQTPPPAEAGTWDPEPLHDGSWSISATESLEIPDSEEEGDS